MRLGTQGTNEAAWPRLSALWDDERPRVQLWRQLSIRCSVEPEVQTHLVRTRGLGGC